MTVILQKHNTSGYRGVRIRDRNRNKCWIAEVSVDGKRKFIGSYETARCAAIARNEYIDEHNLPLIKNEI